MPAARDDGGFRILLTNDDGIGAPGLAACAEALCAAGCYDVRVTAPESERSGSGHPITLGHSLEARYDSAMLRLSSGRVVAAAAVRGSPAVWRIGATYTGVALRGGRVRRAWLLWHCATSRRRMYHL